MTILQMLQHRREQACDVQDWPAYDAFDILIGHVLGLEEMYVKMNQTVRKAEREHREAAKA